MALSQNFRPSFRRTIGPRDKRGERLGPSRYQNRHNFGYLLDVCLIDGFLYFFGGVDNSKGLTSWYITGFVVISLALRFAQQPYEVHHVIKWRRKAQKLVRFCRDILCRTKVRASEMCQCMENSTSACERVCANLPIIFPISPPVHFPSWICESAPDSVLKGFQSIGLDPDWTTKTYC